MNLALASSLTFPANGLLGILLYVAVFAVVIWAVVALIRWSGIPIPEPVRIIFIALAAIGLILLLFRAFSAL